MNQASGIAPLHRPSRNWEQDEVRTTKLVARIKSKMGRYVSHPSAVNVTARNGHVTLSGPILADETRALIDCVNGVPGREIGGEPPRCPRLRRSHPSLQGGRTCRKYKAAHGVALLPQVYSPWLARARCSTACVPEVCECRPSGNRRQQDIGSASAPHGETPGY
jgi:hypothetical protein